MKERAEEALRQFSLWYDDELERQHIKQDTERTRTGMSQSYIAKCTNPDEDCNFYAGLIPLSAVAPQIITKLAADIGYTVIPSSSGLNGSTADEKRRGLEVFAVMIGNPDDLVCEMAQWTHLEIVAAKAKTELRKLGVAQ